jgi:hypothetical protein
MKTLKTYLLVAIALLATLVGCGPGTGGTGTGPSISAAPVSGPVSYAGEQSAQGAVFGGSVAEKAASIFGPSVSALNNAVLTLDVNRVDLRKACQSFAFVGDWSIAMDGTSQLTGAYSSVRILPDGSIDVVTLPATLTLAFASGNASSHSVRAFVKDLFQTPLIGPIDLQMNSAIGGGLTACAPN